ncbi:MAG: hypothetical protein LBF86_04820 [Helicobacteraceae bacterium]|nr:hypothetical protein [Helicobacteraceae bacterium]
MTIANKEEAFQMMRLATLVMLAVVLGFSDNYEFSLREYIDGKETLIATDNNRLGDYIDLSSYQSWDGIFLNFGYKKSYGSKVEAGIEDRFNSSYRNGFIDLSRTILTLDNDVKITLKWEDISRGSGKNARCSRLSSCATAQFEYGTTFIKLSDLEKIANATNVQVTIVGARQSITLAGFNIDKNFIHRTREFLEMVKLERNKK